MQLAQLNIAESRYPMTDTRMETFTGRINAINALADRSEGFVWRLVDDNPETDGALDLVLPGNDTALVNMSVWNGLQSLFGFVYKTAHAKVMTDNRDNFENLTTRHMVLWWVEDGHRPTLGEAADRLAKLQSSGPGPEAFDFKTPFNEHGRPVTPQFPKKDCA